MQFRDSLIIQRNISSPSSRSRSKPGNKQAEAGGLLLASAGFLPDWVLTLKTEYYVSLKC
jgi:hypothetical protein